MGIVEISSSSSEPNSDTMRVLITSATLVAVATAQSNFICPEKDGYFEDTRQCDKYYDCFDGIPEERLCPDGLVFYPFSRKREPCDHYFNVDCGDRLDLQPPKGPNDLCPRLNGSYSHPDEFGQFDPHPKYADPNDCANFYVCLNGISPREQGCELGLVFNELTLQCDAPENVPECKDYYAFLDEDEDNKRRK